MTTEADNVKTSLENLLSIVENIEKKLAECLESIKTAYKTYLTATKNSNDSPGNNNSFMLNDVFKEADTKYKTITKTLNKISELIAEDHTDVIAIGNAVISTYKEKEIYKNNINLVKQSSNLMQKYQELPRLNSKYQKIVTKYNKLAAMFNDYAMKFKTIDSYFTDGMIIYSSSATGKKYSISMNHIVEWFNDLTQNDDLSVLRNEIIKKLIENYTSTQGNLTSLHETPIALIDASTGTPQMDES